MSKNACEKRDFKNSDQPEYVCKRCGARVKKEYKVCKPVKLK